MLESCERVFSAIGLFALGYWTAQLAAVLDRRLKAREQAKFRRAFTLRPRPYFAGALLQALQSIKDRAAL